MDNIRIFTTYRRYLNTDERHYRTYVRVDVNGSGQRNAALSKSCLSGQIEHGLIIREITGRAPEKRPLFWEAMRDWQ